MKSCEVRWGQLIPYSLLFVVLLTIPLYVSNYYVLHILILSGIWIILTISLHLLMVTGVVTLGHAAFMGIGAYSSAILTMKLGWSFWAALPAAGLITVIIAMLVGVIFLRVKGLMFAIITFAFGEAVRLVFMNWREMGTTDGLIGIPAPDTILLPWGMAIQFVGKIPYYYLVLIVVSLSVLIIHRVERSRLGRILSNIEENDSLAESVGVNVQGYRLLSFTIACFFAGIAGSLFGHYHSYLVPDEFGVWTSTLIFLLCVIGGTSSILGPIIGALFLTIIPEAFRGAKVYQPLIYALLVLAVIFVLPEGLISLPKRVRQWLQRKPAAPQTK
jgi:branched-chain amino acid transport system permease protein